MGNGPSISLRPSLFTEHHFVSNLNDLARDVAPRSTDSAFGWQTDKNQRSGLSVGSGVRDLHKRTHWLRGDAHRSEWLRSIRPTHAVRRFLSQALDQTCSRSDGGIPSFLSASDQFSVTGVREEGGAQMGVLGEGVDPSEWPTD